MTDAVLGFVLALLGSVSFGTYILPRKLSKLSVIDYQFWLAIMVAPLSVVVCLIAGAPMWGRGDLIWWSFFCGPLWTLGSLCYSAAVDHIGVTRSTPVKNLAPVFASAYGILIFHEYTLDQPSAMAMTVGGVLLMCLAAFIIGRASAHDHETAKAFDISRNGVERKRSMLLGVLYSLGAAFFYGAYSVPLKHVFKEHMSAYTACAWLGVGVLVSSMAIYVARTGRLVPAFPGAREIRIAQTAGAIWTSGQLLGALAMIFIPMSISWPVSNLSTLFAVAWGIWIFKEVQLDKHKGEMAMAGVMYVAGLVLLALAAPRGHV